MYKNQLQELAQRSCFNLPSYTSIREGPDHAPRFKVYVNFNGESFESPTYCSTLRQAEHSAAEVALNALAGRGPSNSLAARILDETGVYKNLLQEVSQKVGAPLPTYTTIRSGAGHLPVFRCTVELAGVIFNGEPAKSKKQAEKNAAMSAWLSLKALQQSDPTTEKIHKDELEHVTVARALQKYLIKNGRSSIPIKFPTPSPRPSTMHQPQSSTSKILPFICAKSAPRNRPVTSVSNSSPYQNMSTTQFQQMMNLANESYSSLQDHLTRAPPPHHFPAAGAAPYIPVGHFNHKSAPPVNVRQMVPVFSAPPLHSPRPLLGVRAPPPIMGGPPPVCMRRAVPMYAASPVRVNEMQKVHPAVRIENPRVSVSPAIQAKEPCRLDSHFPKLTVNKPEELTGSSEVSKVEVKPPVAKVKVEPPVAKTDGQGSSTKASARQTSVEVQDKLNVSAEIAGLKDLKI